ncbi:MAG TPA: DNA replication/repair protein RecF [Streptosporangiaceae bacterium]|nr:DNA replication/repair protein RecF [Streptosporangiaceae bacterium]
MHLTRLALNDFRSYTELVVELTPGVTTFSGLNGEGKTNLVEGIGYLATLGSHRVATDAPLVRRGAERAILRAMVSGSRGDALVEIELNPGKANRVRLNRAPLPRPREILGVLRTVLFAPEDLALVKGDPGERRRFLDDLLIATAPRYAAVRADYERVVKQRTALLKSAGTKSHLRGPAREAMTATLDAWDAQLAKAGAPLLAGRLRLTEALRPHVVAAYTQVSGGKEGVANLAYRSTVDVTTGNLEEALLKASSEVRSSELDRGVCLVGPHRDELELSIGGMPARGYASHGESWSMALALRLASFELLRDGQEDPVLILDDVFAELDSGRRERLAAMVSAAEQVLITAAVPEDVPAMLTGTRFRVAAGTAARGE